MSQAPSKKTYIERSTEIVQEMQAYRAADGTLRLPRELSDLIEKYILGLSELADHRQKTIETMLPLAKEAIAARKSV